MAKVIAEDDIYGEIGEILAGKKAGRESAEEITIFDTTGMGIQDNVTAMRVYEIAKRKGTWPVVRVSVGKERQLR